MEAPVSIEHEYPKSVTDTLEAVYRLTSMLGIGGQGAVFRTREGGVAVKLVYQKESGDRSELQARLGKMQTRPLWNWPISRPAAVLRSSSTATGSYNGYVMDLLEDIEPIWKLIGPGRTLPDHQALLEWYNKTTGGLRRRLILLAGVAETLAWLNGIPFVYADPSPNNILIPKNLADESVWLIDPDNIGLAGGDRTGAEAGTPGAMTAYTEGYAAPEVINGENGKRVVSTLSDRFAFAVIAFRVLTTRHPYVGDEIDECEPKVMAEESFRGKAAYVDHPADNSNRCNAGILPRSLVLSRELQRLAEETFVEGRDDPEARPGLGRWATALRTAAGITVPCTHCGATFFPGNREGVLRSACPWCGKPRDGFAHMRVDHWVADITDKDGTVVWEGKQLRDQPPKLEAVVPASGFRITRRIASAGSFYEPHEPLMEVVYRSDGLVFKPEPRAIGQFWTDDDEDNRIVGTTLARWRGPQHKRYIGPVHFGPKAEDHRIATFFDKPAP